MSILTSEINSLSQFCYSLMYLLILLFWLRPNLAIKYSKIFSFIARARGHLRLWRWIFFKSIRINVQVQLMKLKMIYCQKSRIFSQKARAHLLISVQNQKMPVIYIILCSHAKNQPPRTMLSPRRVIHFNYQTCKQSLYFHALSNKMPFLWNSKLMQHKSINWNVYMGHCVLIAAWLPLHSGAFIN